MKSANQTSKPILMDEKNWKQEWIDALSAYLDIKPVPIMGRIFATGMGGSGIVAETLKHVANRRLSFSRMPIRERFEWVLAISYSGNTTETMHTVKEMKKLGCKVIAVTSGDRLGKLADVVVKLPPNMLPRDAFPYILSASLAIIGCKTELKEAIRAVKKTNLRKSANIVKSIYGKSPVIYSSGWMIVVAKRFKQQLNENAKVFAFFSKMPDAFHNDIEPFFWHEKNGFIPVIIGNGYLAYKTAKLIPGALHIKAKKTSRVEEVVGSIYLLDYVSVQLAHRLKQDRISIPGITKGREVISGLRSFHKKVG
ncbi:MAG: hypothetical protein KGH77_04365 [Candidatus Micrarchaeota archaeon]|nr:hypothetical protein [Candidatus Micrarchaeota archaeon]MDE1864630.1 hypothetical protein [Candidatus Micrarchaeota archaeon]